jgi:hypothetical protein
MGKTAFLYASKWDFIETTQYILQHLNKSSYKDYSDDIKVNFANAFLKNIITQKILSLNTFL